MAICSQRKVLTKLNHYFNISVATNFKVTRQIGDIAPLKTRQHFTAESVVQFLFHVQVRYRCVRRSARSLVRVCEHSRRVIGCHWPKKINILSANYGRLTGGHVCGGPIRTTNCRAAWSLGKVRGDCQGRSYCTLHATNSKFGDPCYGTFKYLEVRFFQ